MSDTLQVIHLYAISHLFVGFDELDLLNYEVCKKLQPYVLGSMGMIEGRDRIVAKIERKGDQLWFYPDQSEEWKADAVVKNLPPGFYDHLRDISESPRIPFPAPPGPHPKVAAQLLNLDHNLFGEDAPEGRVWMNARSYADVRKFRRDRLDHESRIELLRQGFVATLYAPDFDLETATETDFKKGRQIWCSRAVPEGHILIDNGVPVPHTELTFRADNLIDLDRWLNPGAMFVDIIRWMKSNPHQKLFAVDNPATGTIGFAAFDDNVEAGSGKADPNERAWSIGIARIKHLYKRVDRRLQHNIAKVLEDKWLMSPRGRQDFCERVLEVEIPEDLKGLNITKMESHLGPND